MGDPGVGKTAIAEGLAKKIVDGEAPAILADAVIFSLDMGALLAGTRYRGDFEERLKSVVKELEEQPKAVLFIDEIHTVIGAGATSGGAMDASNLLKPALQSGQLRCMGSTTYKEYRQHFEKDRALARRFQKIDVNEPSIDDTIKIVMGIKPYFEEFHGLKYTNEAVRTAVELSARYINDRKLPDKAIDVIDEAGASQWLLPEAKRRKQIGAKEIEQVIAKMARIPSKQVSKSDAEQLRSLETDLKRVVFGQDDAITALSAAIKLARAGLREPNKPIGSYLFSGPTGVGKTEVAPACVHSGRRDPALRHVGVHGASHRQPPDRRASGLCRLRPGRPADRRVDQHPHSRAPARRDREGAPGPVQHPAAGDGQRHADRRQRQEGRLPERDPDHDDQCGRSRRCKEVDRLWPRQARGRERRGDQAPVHAGIPQPPRCDDTFAGLSPEIIEQVVEKFILQLEGQLADRNVNIVLSPKARKWLATRGYDPAYGARPLGRLIQEEIKKPLAEELLFGSLQKGGSVKIDVDKSNPDKLAFKFLEETRAAAKKPPEPEMAE